MITVEALLAAVDGHVVLRSSARDTDPVAAGRAAAAELMARGGQSLLEDSSLVEGGAA
jgi:hypothetical protein